MMSSDWVRRLGGRFFGSGSQIASLIYQFLPYSYTDESGKSLHFVKAESPTGGIIVRIQEINGGITEITVPESEFQRLLDEKES